MPAMRICLDARLAGGKAGGIEQVVIGMAHGLSQLTDGDEKYLFLTHPGWESWISPYLGANCELLFAPAPKESRLRKAIRGIPGARAALSGLTPVLPGRRLFRVPISDGTIEKAPADLMHFLHQQGFVSSVPSIYHPHDLQYIHLPQYQSRRDRVLLDILYRKLCEQARVVAVASTWGRQDIVRQFGLAPEKVQVVPLAPGIEAYPVPTGADLASARARLNLPESFVFFPAQTWPHKNHLGLIEALAILRDRHGLNVPLVSSGRHTDFYPTIEKRIRGLGLAGQVQFPGFVSPLDLQCLYRLSRCVVVPTEFEAGSFPIWEAFLAETPVACSNVTSLPVQAGDAALIFDPHAHGEIADAVKRLWTEGALRQDLVKRGKESVRRFTWQRTARHFRALYRQIGGRELTNEDRALLASTPLL